MDINHYKEKLEEERLRLEGILSKIAGRKPENPENWEARLPDMNLQTMDPAEMADKAEEAENLIGQETALEEWLNEVKDALERIEKGTYGVCAKGGEKISEERLEANPAAKTCIEHLEE